MVECMAKAEQLIINDIQQSRRNEIAREYINVHLLKIKTEAFMQAREDLANEEIKAEVRKELEADVKQELYKSVKVEVAKKHQAEVAALKTEYNDKMKELQDTLERRTKALKEILADPS